jgi:hypothetical protein
MPNKKTTTNTDTDKPYEPYEQRAEEIKRRKVERESRKIVQLKIWPNEFRAAPSLLLRSALFGLVERGKRKAVKQELLASWSGLELRYTGWQLDQADLDVWMQALHQARECLGSRVVLNSRAFIRALGRAWGTGSREWLHSAFVRMQACGVNLRIDGFEYQGSLIREFAFDHQIDRWIIEINPRLAKLFDDSGATTLLPLKERRQLKTDIAKWLEGYVRSHKATKRKPHRIRIETLRDLCGSQVKRIRKFREGLTRAMDELTSASVVDAWSFISEGSVLEFSRPPKH